MSDGPERARQANRGQANHGQEVSDKSLYDQRASFACPGHNKQLTGIILLLFMNALSCTIDFMFPLNNDLSMYEAISALEVPNFPLAEDVLRRSQPLDDSQGLRSKIIPNAPVSQFHCAMIPRYSTSLQILLAKSNSDSDCMTPYTCQIPLETIQLTKPFSASLHPPNLCTSVKHSTRSHVGLS